MTSPAKPTKNRRSFAPGYFEKLYSRDHDPWHFATSPYEHSKYATTLEVLKGQPLGTVFEVGCSIGILTKTLAVNCGSVLAIDVSKTAILRAKRNCEALGNVTIARMRIPAEWPSGSFDLILLSEVLYFLGPTDIRATAGKTLRSLSSAGRVLLVNWLGDTDYPCGGEEACNIFISALNKELKVIERRRTQDYRLDLLGWSSSQSAAARET
jgi:SAM-dependent methyltransferase